MELKRAPEKRTAPPMIDALERVTGKLEYVIDIELPGMLHGKVLRSPFPHARIARLDASAALELPGVIAVLTREDLVGSAQGAPLVNDPYHGPQVADQPIVAIDKVCHVGDAVAAVAAEDPETAEEALLYIDVEYEELPAVFDPVEAMQPGAPLVHELGDDFLGTAAYFGINPLLGTNCPHRYSLRVGDVERGFAEADHVIEGTFRVPSAAHVPMEPQCSIAYFNEDGLTVYTNTQTPFNVRDALAHMFGLPQERVRVLIRTLGGAYGAKTFMHAEPIAVALARKTGRPVKVMYSRAETFTAVNRHPMVATIRLGVKNDGRITAKKVIAYYDTGAYADSGPGVAQKGGYASVGPYRIPNVWVDSHCVYTNLPRNGAYRGYAVTQIAFASEAIMDMAAQRIGMDPLEFRLKNLLHNGDTFATGQYLDDVQFEACLRDAAEAIDWTSGVRSVTPEGKLRGKGLAVLIKGMLTPGKSTAAVELSSDGRAFLHTGTVELGQGARTIIAQIAGEVLDLPYDAFEVTLPDTDFTPFDSRTTSSRSTYMMGNAVREAAEDLRCKLIELAAAHFGAPPEAILLQNGRVYPASGNGAASDAGLTYAELLARQGIDCLVGNGSHQNPGGLDAATGMGVASSHWHQGAGAVEVEVDPETGKVDILKCYSCVYAGRVINHLLAELQTEGNMIFGVGSALFEEIVFDQGQVINSNLSDYLIPSMMDMPLEMRGKLLEIPGAVSHGVGETALPAIPAAVGNAVANAVGVRLHELPITPEKVLRALGRLS
jgi:CO/xanthine dehydrogenase Mo-binding subunit